MNIDVTKLPVLWYEDQDRNIYVPGPDEDLDPPPGFDYMHSRFPLEVHHGVLKLHRDASGKVVSSDRLMEGVTTYHEDVVLGILKRWGKSMTLSQAILVAATACERCTNAILFSVTTGVEGYREGGPEWREAGTSCQFCREG